MPHNIGNLRRIPIRDLVHCVGWKLCEPIRGARGKVLVDEGEILTQLHVNKLMEWENRPGSGRLSLYTREVWAVCTTASGDLEPKCMDDYEKSYFLQKRYRSKYGPGMRTR